jgi:competence protein ComEA
VLLAAAALLLALFVLQARSTARRPALSPVADDPSLEVRVDINAATAAELEALPGIGPGRARQIVERRASTGRFRTFEDLAAVPGIGARTLETLRPLVTLGDGKP